MEAALLETYASGSIASFCNLLAIDVFKKKPKEKKTVSRKRCTETDHSTPPLETKIMQEDAARCPKEILFFITALGDTEM